MKCSPPQPFAGETISDVIAALLTREPAPLQKDNPRIPAELERIVTKSLAKDRAERYESAKIADGFEGSAKRIELRRNSTHFAIERARGSADGDTFACYNRRRYGCAARLRKVSDFPGSDSSESTSGSAASLERSLKEL